MSDAAARLLAPDEADPVETYRLNGASPVVLTCEHAGRAFPRRLGALELDPRDLDRHIAYDIGALGVAKDLSRRLDAALIAQHYSRLVVDCNRAPHMHDFIPTVSEDTAIPSNLDLSPRDREARASEIFHPYHRRITAVLDARMAEGGLPVLVSVHTCTPIYQGVRRPWHVGLLHEHDPALAGVLLRLLGADRDLTVGDNQPYALTPDRDYTLPVHGQQRGIHHVAFEVRQDLVATAAGQSEWAERLAELLSSALAELGIDAARQSVRARDEAGADTGMRP